MYILSKDFDIGGNWENSHQQCKTMTHWKICNQFIFSVFAYCNLYWTYLWFSCLHLLMLTALLPPSRRVITWQIPEDTRTTDWYDIEDQTIIINDKKSSNWIRGGQWLKHNRSTIDEQLRAEITTKGRHNYRWINWIRLHSPLTKLFPDVLD